MIFYYTRIPRRAWAFISNRDWPIPISKIFTEERRMARDKGEIQSGRFRVPYRIYGESGVMIFCVNGIQQTMAAWRSVISRFSKDFRVVVFDLPSQGRAEILSGPP